MDRGYDDVDRCFQGIPTHTSLKNGTQMDYRILETSANANKKDKERFVTVTVPDIEQLGLDRPSDSII